MPSRMIDDVLARLDQALGLLDGQLGDVGVLVARPVERATR